MLALIDFDLKSIFEAFESATGIDIPDCLENITTLVIVFGGILFLIYKFILNPIHKTHRWRKNQLNQLLVGYKRYTTWWQRWLYIKTWFQNDPPNEHEEPYQSQFEDLRTSSIKFFLKNVLKQSNDNPPYYCILGGSGMGKSTFVVQLVRKYINKYREKTLPFPLKLLYCGASAEGKDTLLERINKIENKGNTVLILDALDENNDAIDDYGSFQERLLESIAEFRIVIITCRTQFFEKQEEELEKSNIRRNGEGQVSFKKYYVSPFNEEEVNKYLNKKFLIRFFAKRKALQIVNNCKKVMARPLLLSYMDDLLKADISKGKESIVDIYQILIDKWLEREAVFAVYGEENRKEYKKNLLEFSNKLALCMARPSYKQSDIADIFEGYKDLIHEKNLKSRSLLNRNSKYELKFAHKSFMEYLVAKQLFEQNKNEVVFSLEEVDCFSNDMIPLFFFYMLSKGCPISIEFSNNKVSVSDFYYYNRKLGSSNLQHKLCIEDNDSTTVALNLYAFLKTICNTKYNNRPVRIIIDCNYSYLRFITSINDIFSNHTEVAYLDKSLTVRVTASNKGEIFIIPELVFENYNFRDSEMVTFIDKIDDIIPCIVCLGRDCFPDPRIVSQLIDLTRGRWRKREITIRENSDHALTHYLESHMRAVLSSLKQNEPAHGKIRRILSSGLDDFSVGRNSYASRLFKEALETSEEVFGSDHWATQSIQEIVKLMELFGVV